MPEIELFGETFTVTDDPGDIEFAYMEFAEIAEKTDASSTAGTAATMGMLRACLVDDAEWGRFKEVCRKNRARAERDLLPLLAKVMAGVTDRPTQRSSVSTDGPEHTAPNSTADAYLAERLAGRPDLYLFVEDARAANSA